MRREDLLVTEEVHQGVEVVALLEAEVTSLEAEGDHQEVAHLEVIKEGGQEEVHLEVTQEAALEADHLGVDPEEEMKEGLSEEEALPSEGVNEIYLSFQLIKTLIHKIYCFFR